MNDAAALQAAAWLGAQAVWLYAAGSMLLVAVTLVGWSLLPPRWHLPVLLCCHPHRHFQ